jgi:hypothetical protein
MYKTGALYRAMIDGYMAQRKLRGDPDVIAPYNKATLRAIVRQGNQAEETCRERGYLDLISRAKIMGGVADEEK